jgi:DNA-binding NarL/FixJ family response regulator
MSPEFQENLLALRRACQALDQARTGSTAHSPVRWSVLERFEYEDRLYRVTVRPARPRSTGLTPRETQVLGFIRGGHTNKVIAFELGVAWSTVRVLVHRISRKMGVRTRAELVRLLQGEARSELVA